jgi:hypothetical protein
MAAKAISGWGVSWSKPDRRSIYDWAHEHMTLPPSYAIPGKFDVAITRPLISVFDAIQDTRIHRVRMRKPPRFGGSMIADLSIPWIICNDPGPVMWNWQSDADAKGHMKEKAWELWRSCRPFKAMLPPNRHDTLTTEIYFGPFFVVCQGANINNLQSKGIRWLFNDETWLPVWQDLYTHAEARTGDYRRTGAYKIVDVSQAGIKNDVEDANYREGTQAVWCYEAAGKVVPLDLRGGKRDDGSRWGLLWNDDAKLPSGKWSIARAIETARYSCAQTATEWPDTEGTRAEWNRTGRYVVTNENAAPGTVSFSVNGLLNYSFADLVSMKIKAMQIAEYGDMSAMRDFVQKYECRPWEEVHLSVSITTNRGGYSYADFSGGQPIDGEVHRAMTADRQHGIAQDVPHRWVEIRAYRKDGTSRQLYFGRVNTKEGMRAIQLQYHIKDRCVWQDARFEKHEVFKECVEYGWLAVFGSDQNSWTHYTKGARDADPVKVTLPYSPIQMAEVPGAARRVAYIHFNEGYFSDILANLIGGTTTGWDHPDDWSGDHQAQLLNKQKMEKRPGVFNWETVKNRPDHGFDTSKMQVCFAVMMRLLTAGSAAAPAAEQPQKPLWRDAPTRRLQDARRILPE